MRKTPKGHWRGYKGDKPGKQGVTFASPLLKKIGKSGKTTVVK